jgi:hypothetical protein
MQLMLNKSRDQVVSDLLAKSAASMNEQREETDQSGTLTVIISSSLILLTSIAIHPFYSHPSPRIEQTGTWSQT